MTVEINRERLVTFLYLPLIVMAGFALRIINYNEQTWSGYIFYVVILDLFLLATLLMDRRRPGSFSSLLLWGTHIPASILLIPFVLSKVAAGGKKGPLCYYR